jgi:hypothetical protein
VRAGYDPVAYLQPSDEQEEGDAVVAAGSG